MCGGTVILWPYTLSSSQVKTVSVHIETLKDSSEETLNKVWLQTTGKDFHAWVLKHFL